MTNQALLFAIMGGNGNGHLLPPPDSYRRQAAERRKQGEKWASRVSGLVFGGLMLAFGRSTVEIKDSSGATIKASEVSTNDLVKAVLSQNESIQYSQIARETVKPLIEDIAGWVAQSFYPSEEESELMLQMLQARMGGSAQPLGGAQSGYGMGSGWGMQQASQYDAYKSTMAQYEGRGVKLADGAAIYLVQNGILRWGVSWEVLGRYGVNSSNYVTLPVTPSGSYFSRVIIGDPLT